MFETRRNSEVFLPKVFQGSEDTQAWSHVSKRLHTPWLYIICCPSGKEVDQAPKILFLSNAMDLLVIQKDTSSTISEAYAVLPGYLNGSDSWKMSLLDHILIGNEPIADLEQHAYIYVLKNKQRFVDSALSTKEDDLKSIRLLCRI